VFEKWEELGEDLREYNRRDELVQSTLHVFMELSQ
jgi:hypothetical protein